MGRSGTSLQLEVGQFSHPGRKRTNNEDWLGAFQPDDAGRLATKGSLFLVADGMGGHRSGELASRRAVDHVIRTYFDDPDPDVAASLERAIQAANSALYAAAAESPERGRCGTTLVAAVIQEQRPRALGLGGAGLWIANVGDSRAYLSRGRELRQLSRDHSWAAAVRGQTAKGGEGPGQHVVTRALGLRPEVKVDIFAFRLQPGDQILLCSDGLTGPLPDDEIGAIVQRRAPQEAARRLVEAANGQGGPDNVSVILVRLASQPSSWREAWDTVVDRFWPGDVGQAAAGLSTAALIALVLLAVLVLLGLGFVLGWVLF